MGQIVPVTAGRRTGASLKEPVAPYSVPPPPDSVPFERHLHHRLVKEKSSHDNGTHDNPAEIYCIHGYTSFVTFGSSVNNIILPGTRKSSSLYARQGSASAQKFRRKDVNAREEEDPFLRGLDQMKLRMD